MSCPHKWYHLLCQSYRLHSHGRDLRRSRSWRPWLERLRGGGTIVERAVWSHRIILSSLALYQHLRLAQYPA